MTCRQKQLNSFPENDQEEGLSGKLPLVITDITVQKKNKSRYSLFSENLFLIGVSGKTLTDYSLQKGVVLTPFLFNRLKKSEEFNAVKESCLRYLGRRDHASFELRQKIAKKGFDPDIISQVIESLVQQRLVDDEQFAAKFALDKLKYNKWGPGKIKSELIKKGISKKTAANIIKNLADNLQQEQICVDLVLKRKRHFLRENDSYKRKQKIFTYLAGRGFSGSVIQRCFQQIDAKLDA